MDMIAGGEKVGIALSAVVGIGLMLLAGTEVITNPSTSMVREVEPAITARAPTKWLADDCQTEWPFGPAETYEAEINVYENFHYKFIDKGDLVKIERTDPDGRGLFTYVFYRTEAACRAANQKAHDDHERWLAKYR